MVTRVVDGHLLLVALDRDRLEVVKYKLPVLLHVVQLRIDLVAAQDAHLLTCAHAHEPRREVDRRPHHAVLTPSSRHPHEPTEGLTGCDPHVDSEALRGERLVKVACREQAAASIVLKGSLRRVGQVRGLVSCAVRGVWCVW